MSIVSIQLLKRAQNSEISVDTNYSDPMVPVLKVYCQSLLLGVVLFVWTIVSYKIISKKVDVSSYLFLPTWFGLIVLPFVVLALLQVIK